jgi:Protein of unknown function (DUF3341)
MGKKRAIGGIAGIFLNEHKVVNAAYKVREAGYKKLEAISPYPIHAMEAACDIKRSAIPYVTFVAGFIGLVAAVALTYYTSVTDWPLNIGGKPLFSLPAFVPIMFELTVLFAALASVGAFMFFCGMPRISTPPPIDKDLTCDKFAIFIPENDTGFNYERCEKLLKELGAVEIKKVMEF